MLLLDQREDTPERHLAIDEALLACAENGDTGEALRFWEGSSPFVVLGVSQKYRQETHWEACQRDGVPVLRRCSAGGCVLQGPGSLNYSFVLDMSAAAELSTIRSSYCLILQRICDALAESGVGASLSGTSDIAVSGQKISGNAQRRKRRYLLHHGTLLYRLDDLPISTYLREPEDRPAYRGARDHAAFVRSVDIDCGAVKGCIAKAFGCSWSPGALPGPVDAVAERLVREKYGQDGWNLRR